jgi:ubiquinone/menaquinone biosynthesis C-methylase UbiE
MVKHINDQFHIPYEDEKFDLIVSNQVVEHVHDLRTMISEFNRVLKPNGQAMLLCPTLETVIEWHLMVPFVHWFNNYQFTQKLLLRLFDTVALGAGVLTTKMTGLLISSNFYRILRGTGRVLKS